MNQTSCQCHGCSYPWKGEQCEICQLAIDLQNGINVCGLHGELDPSTCSCICNDGWGGARCESCVRHCAHGSLQNDTCSCHCSGQWTGTDCSVCPITCQNGGILDTTHCYCQCDSDHSGTFCQGGSCYPQIACDACLSVSDGCHWCGQTASCSQAAGPGQVSSCVGPSRSGMCPPHGECQICAYTASETRWLAANGELASIQSFDSAMPN